MNDISCLRSAVRYSVGLTCLLARLIQCILFIVLSSSQIELISSESGGELLLIDP